MTTKEINTLIENMVEHVCNVEKRQITIIDDYNSKYNRYMVYVNYVGRNKAEQIYSIMGGKIQKYFNRYSVGFPLRNVFG